MPHSHPDVTEKQDFQGSTETKHGRQTIHPRPRLQVQNSSVLLHLDLLITSVDFFGLHINWTSCELLGGTTADT